MVATVVTTGSLVGDPTYADLPAIGSKNGRNKLASLMTNLGLEALGPRQLFFGSTGTGGSYMGLEESERLYLYGRPDGKAGDKRPTKNRIQSAINTYTASAFRTPPSMVFKAGSISDTGFWVVSKPSAGQKDVYLIAAPTGPMTGPDGLPMVDAMGQPMQGPMGPPIPIKLYERIPDELMEAVEPRCRVQISTENVISYYQSVFNIKRRNARLDDEFLSLIHKKQKQPLTMALFEWDSVTQLPLLEAIPPQQWYPDPQREQVARMNYVRLDLAGLDANEAKRRFPAIAKAIDKYCSRSLQKPSGAYSNSGLYLSAYQRPTVTLCILWLRNQPAPMSLEEALSLKLVEMVDHPDQGLGAAPGEAPAAPGMMAPGEAEPDPIDPNTAADPANSPAAQIAPDATQGQVQQIRQYVRNVATGEDVTQTIDPETGDTVYHPNWPQKLVTRQTVKILEEVVQDIICPHWDIPVVLNKNIPIDYRPYSQPETERMRSLQISINEFHTYVLDNGAFQRSPSGFVDKTFLEKYPELVNSHMTPGRMYAVEMDDPNCDISKKVAWYPPSPLPPSGPIILEKLDKDFDQVADNPSVRQGNAPTGVHSGVAIAQLQSAAETAGSFKSLFDEQMIWRVGMLTIHAIANWMSAEDLWKVNRSVPLPIVQRYFLPIVRGDQENPPLQWDLDVEMTTGAGMVKVQENNQIRADAIIRCADGKPLITSRIARKKLDYDDDQITQDLKHDQEEMAQQPQVSGAAV